jgi:hypothetical protein
MNQHADDDVRKLERGLIESYRSRQGVAYEVDVTQHVMRDVHRLSSEGGGWTPAAMLAQWIWRTATITAAVVLMVTIMTVGLFRPQVEGAAVLTEDFESVPLLGE